jgi:hypothetical protein
MWLWLTMTASMSIAASAAPQTAPAISVDTMKSVTRELSSDAYEGRAPGEAKTVAYLIARMQVTGLTPGKHGEWT